MQLTILGFNSAIPTITLHPTSQFLNICERHFLIDCGEGTQVQLRKAKAKFSKINYIFISHLHGDHVFGLVGLISTFRLLGRKKPLTIFGPKGIKQFIEIQLQLSNTYSSYELIFKELSSNESKLIYEDKKVEVYTLPLKHRIYCNGYLFKEKEKQRHLNMLEINKYPAIDISDYKNLKKGKNFVLSNGKVIKNEKLTFEADKSLSYAFCSDTLYDETLIPLIQQATVLYHESTFLDSEKEWATKTGHSTAKEAAIIAKKSKVHALILGHFSNKHKDYIPFLEEAKSIFSNSYLPKELVTLKLSEL